MYKCNSPTCTNVTHLHVQMYVSPGLNVCVCDSPYVTENNKECTSEIHDFLVGSQDLGTFVNILSYKDPGVISFETATCSPNHQIFLCYTVMTNII